MKPLPIIPIPSVSFPINPHSKSLTADLSTTLRSGRYDKLVVGVAAGTTHKLVISTGANPDFLPRCTRQCHACTFPQRKVHELYQRHQPLQEIRGSAVERSAV